MNEIMEILHYVGYLCGLFLIAVFAVWISHTSGCHSSRRDFYEALDRDSELKREQDKLPIMLRKQAGGNWK